MTCMFGLRKIRNRALRRPFQPAPVYRTASTTRKPCWAENSAKRASCRSKSAFWPGEETLAYKATPGGSLAGAAWTITVSVASGSAGAGNWPAFHRRHAVL